MVQIDLEIALTLIINILIIDEVKFIILQNQIATGLGWLRFNFVTGEMLVCKVFRVPNPVPSVGIDECVHSA